LKKKIIQNHNNNNKKRKKMVFTSLPFQLTNSCFKILTKANWYLNFQVGQIGNKNSQIGQLGQTWKRPWLWSHAAVVKPNNFTRLQFHTFIFLLKYKKAWLNFFLCQATSNNIFFYHLKQKLIFMAFIIEKNNGESYVMHKTLS